MTNFFNWWVTIITLVNIAACYWLIRWTMKVRPDEVAAGEAMDHSWDGLQELNNSLPRWWLWLFYGTIIFALGYLVIYPGLGNYKGLLGWSSHGQYDEEVAQSNAKYGPIFAAFSAKSIPQLIKDPAAMKAGERLFSNYCTQCHGSDAKGATHFPNLTDNDWLYGGKPEQIEQTILKGRNGTMPAWLGSLGQKKVDDVASYVQSLSGRPVDKASAEAGKQVFMTMCIGCHGADAKGNQMLGAANLTDKIWLHGGTAKHIKETIAYGRNSHMPAHEKFLGKDKVHLVAAYVYSLSHR